MGSSKTSSRSISTKRRDEIINDCTEKEKLITLFLLHILRTQPQPKKNQATDLDFGKTTMGQFPYLIYFFLSSFIFHLSPFFYQIFYRKAQMHAQSNEAGNGLERSRDTNLSFLVWKYFYKSTFSCFFSLSLSPMCGVASLLAYGKRLGDGYEKLPLGCLFCFFPPCCCFSVFILVRENARSSDFPCFPSCGSFLCESFMLFYLAFAGSMLICCARRARHFGNDALSSPAGSID